MDFNTTKPDTQNEPVKILIYNRTLQFYNKNQKECNNIKPIKICFEIKID